MPLAGLTQFCRLGAHLKAAFDCAETLCGEVRVVPPVVWLFSCSGTGKLWLHLTPGCPARAPGRQQERLSETGDYPNKRVLMCRKVWPRFGWKR